MPRNSTTWVSTFDPDKFDAICERVEAGEMTAPLLREFGIKKPTFYAWMKDRPERAEQYQAAKDSGEEMIVCRLRETARGIGDSAGDVQRDKLIVETDLKILAKFNPKRWGDKTQTEHSGSVAIIPHEEWLAKLDG